MRRPNEGSKKQFFYMCVCVCVRESNKKLRWLTNIISFTLLRWQYDTMMTHAVCLTKFMHPMQHIFIDAKKNLETIVNLIATSYDRPSRKDLYTWYSFNLKLKRILLIFNIHSIYILQSFATHKTMGVFLMLSATNKMTSENTTTVRYVLKLST